MKPWCASPVVLVAALAVPIAISAAPAAEGTLAAVEERIASLRIVEAREALESLGHPATRTPRGRYLMGKILFAEGRFAEARSELGRALEAPEATASWRALAERVMETEAVLAGMTSTGGGGGSFVYRHPPGVDALLVPYADRTLRSQLAALNEEFGDAPRAPIEVVFLENTTALARVSGLTQEQIERTGTVALTKDGRILALSPRALATGYPWLDTLAHELTHLAVTRVAWDRAPIWIHEGVAKLLERRWQGGASASLTPEEAYLLDRAAREGRLIPFSRFHPSVAYLPSQEDAALAYAQVLSFFDTLAGRGEPGWIRRLLESLGRMESVDQAFVSIFRFGVRRLYLWWEQEVRGRRQTPVPAVGFLKRRYARGATSGLEDGESLLGQEARRHLRVGDLLRLRGHLQAAALEYRRAEALAGTLSVQTSDRLAGTLLDLGDAASVASMLPAVAEIHPTHSTVFVQLGLANRALGRLEEAARALERAVELNPFHPRVHCALGETYREMNRPGDADIETWACGLLAASQATREPVAGENP